MKKQTHSKNSAFIEKAIEYYEVRLAYFKKMSCDDAEYAKILIQNYGSLRKALETFENDPNYQKQIDKITSLIKKEDTLVTFNSNYRSKSLLELIDKFEPEREDTVIIDKSELEKRLNKSEE